MLDELHSTLDLCLISEEGEVIFAMQLVKAHREMAEFMEQYAEKEDYVAVLNAAKDEREIVDASCVASLMMPSATSEPTSNTKRYSLERPMTSHSNALKGEEG